MGPLKTRRAVLTGAAAAAAASSAGIAYAANPVTHVVRITSFVFVPERIEVQVGDTIRWVNDDLAPHTATADAFGWDTGEIGNSQAAEIVVTQNMETTYFCVFHPHMTGQIVIG
ncbi:plastocyanin/azurin family copper-binding protein [uncultured Tateyamaria sp.]|uniref:cupredoxin domain-containing protein n=1 Tax=uncultured Tateyamaria sp. TaxID=455651 RepID=UPI00261160D3|nr:plastocyanin/azurin family copper-binding protein [uncultured Tateyamaria sp.]